MIPFQRRSLIALASVLAAPFTVAQAASESDPFGAESFNQVTLSYRAGFNINASFKNLGQLPFSSPGAAIGGVPHTYHNGYVLLDSSDNEGGLTWNWGYDNPGQIMGDNVVMSSSLPGGIGHEVSDDPQHGFELSYLRQVGALGKGQWGIELAFNYTDVSLDNDNTLAEGGLIADAYPLDGIAPPEAPYRGVFDLPGPMIGDVPRRVPVSMTARLDAPVYGFRLGPFLEVPVYKRASALFSAGFALAIVDAEFKYQQTAAVPGGGILQQSGKQSRTETMPGGYVAASLLCRVTDLISLSAGVQYQNVGTFTQSIGDKQAKLDLSESIFVTAGLAFRF
jgi:hypothetical protein